MLNGVFVALVLSSVAIGALFGTMEGVADAAVESAVGAAKLALGLLGQMTLWLGLVRILQEAGLMAALARALSPVMRPLFPGLPPGDPAFGAILLNLSANALGLTNAATPFGLKAMKELQRLQERPGVASDAMIVFVTLTASGVAVLPLGMIAVRSTMGAELPGAIILPSMGATLCSTLVGATLALGLSRWSARPPSPVDAEPGEPADRSGPELAGLADAEQVATIERRTRPLRAALVGVCGVAVAVGFWTSVAGPQGTADGALDAFQIFSGRWLLPLLIAGFVGIGFARGVPVYDAFIRGAKEGFSVVVLIVPYLVGILTAIGLFRACGALDALTTFLAQFLEPLGFPPEALPMALVRPLSGSAALGVVVDTIEAHGANSFVGTLVTVMNGSTDTTFYVLAVYFGSVRVQNVRHALLACLAADFTGVVVATALTHGFFG